MGKIKDLTGQKFGRLTVIRLNHVNKKAYWLCKCDCGNETIVESYNLTRGHTQSCGCIKKERFTNTTHGKSDSRLYKIWESMKYRCSNPNRLEYQHYGGRGITVCDEWNNDFQNFYDWAINNGYDDSLTIDRIDVDGNYEPNNCRWADIKTQANNTTRCIYITYQEKTQTLTQWCEELSLPYDTIRSRLRRDPSITSEKLFRPVRHYK